MAKPKLDPDDALTHPIIGAAIEVHRRLGPGLLESSYEACLSYELEFRGFSVERQVPLALDYRERRLDIGYRLDMLVEKAVIVEVKAVEKVHPIAAAQLLTYLKLSGLSTAVLLNFHVDAMKHGIRRFRLR